MTARMTTLVQSYERSLKFFIGPSETIFVLAGTFQEFMAWKRERPGLSCEYISNVERMMGTMSWPLVARTGTWEERHDAQAIEERWFLVGAAESDFPPGDYVLYPDWLSRTGKVRGA